MRTRAENSGSEKALLSRFVVVVALPPSLKKKNLLTFSHALINAAKSLLVQLENPLDNKASLSATSSSDRGCGSSGPGAICACTTSSLAPCALADLSFSASECLCAS